MNTEGSFIRWQDISIRQLGFTTNLILTINVAVVGFMINKSMDSSFTLTCNGKALFIIGLFILILCFVAGIIINITRLYDYRLTARIARKRETENESSLSDLRRTTKTLGKATWIILIIQFSLLVLGLFFAFASFLIIYFDKLF